MEEQDYFQEEFDFIHYPINSTNLNQQEDSLQLVNNPLFGVNADLLYDNPLFELDNGALFGVYMEFGNIRRTWDPSSGLGISTGLTDVFDNVHNVSCAYGVTLSPFAFDLSMRQRTCTREMDGGYEVFPSVDEGEKSYRCSELLLPDMHTVGIENIGADSKQLGTTGIIGMGQQESPGDKKDKFQICPWELGGVYYNGVRHHL